MVYFSERVLEGFIEIPDAFQGGDLNPIDNMANFAMWTQPQYNGYPMTQGHALQNCEQTSGETNDIATGEGTSDNLETATSIEKETEEVSDYDSELLNE